MILQKHPSRFKKHRFLKDFEWDLCSLRSALCMFGFSTSVPIATSRQHKCAIAHKFQSLGSFFKNASLLFIYHACYAFLLIDVLTVCAMSETIRTGWPLSEQHSEGPVIGTSQPEDCSGPCFWKCFIITKSTHFYCYTARSTISMQTKPGFCISLNIDDMHFRDAYFKILLAFTSRKYD